jgi:hypothetical protein
MSRRSSWSAISRLSSIYMSNFRDAKSFQLIAYSHVSKEVWRPIWNRLIEEVTATVGSQRISATFEN